VAKEMATRGQQLQGVRIDSGDLTKLAAEVRRIFDEADLKNVKIIGSGGLDEYDLADYANANVPYDSYGVGTKMGVSADAPWSDVAYKLVEYDNRPVLKLSTGKVSLPGKKQVFRVCDKRGQLQKDIIALRGENFVGAEPLLKKVVTEGKIMASLPSLEEIRSVFLSEFARLPEPIKAIRNSAHYLVEHSPKLQEHCADIEKQVSRSQ
jgi:nicotinate phosphoribosyltransferase